MTSSASKIEAIKNALGPGRISEHERVVIGTAEKDAELYLEVQTLEDLAKAIRVAREQELPVSIIGLGFVPETGEQIEGLVIKNNCRKFAMLSVKGKIRSGETVQEYSLISVESGVPLNQLVRYCVDAGLGGLEYFLGVSGTVGDALFENAKYEKNGDFLGAHIFTLHLLTKENEEIEVEAEPFLYPLEEEILKKKHALPLSVVFKLTPGEKSELWRRAEAAAFERNQSELTDPLKGNFNY